MELTALNLLVLVALFLFGIPVHASVSFLLIKRYPRFKTLKNHVDLIHSFDDKKNWWHIQHRIGIFGDVIDFGCYSERFYNYDDAKFAFDSYVEKCKYPLYVRKYLKIQVNVATELVTLRVGDTEVENFNDSKQIEMLYKRAKKKGTEIAHTADMKNIKQIKIQK